MPNFEAGKTALFKLDDTANPGYARVKLLKNKGPVPGIKPTWNIWNVEVVEVVKASTASVKSVAKPGQRMALGERLLIAEG